MHGSACWHDFCFLKNTQPHLAKKGMKKMNQKSSGNLWEEIQDQLQIFMKQEISTMREILANIHQEETSLLGNATKSLELILQERSDLIQRLGNLRSITSSMMNRLLSLFSSEKGISSLDEIFTFSNDCEMLLLRDQILALTEKINFELEQNKHLSSRAQRSSFQAYRNLSDYPSKSKKNRIATLVENEEEMGPSA